MTNYTKLYWLTRLDGVNGLFIGMAIVLGLSAVLIPIFCESSKEFDEFKTSKQIEKREKIRTRFYNKLKFVIVGSVLSLLVSVFMPTQKDVIFIVAGGKTIDFIQKDSSVNKIPEQTTLIISKFLETQIENMEGKNKPEQTK